MNKIKTVVDRPEISSDQIKERRNFAALHSNYVKYKVPFYTKYRSLLIISAIIISLGTIYFYQYSKSNSLPISDNYNTNNLIINKKHKADSVTTKANEHITFSENKVIKPKADRGDVHKNSMVSFKDSTFASTLPSVSTSNNNDYENKIMLLEAEILELKQKIQKLEKEEPLKPVKASGQRFKLDVSPKEFPKLAKYKDLLFEVSPDEKNLTSDFFTKEWDSGKLKADADGNYLVTLSRKNKSYTFKVFPVLEGNAYTAATATYANYTKTKDSLSSLLLEKEAIVSKSK